MRLICTILFTCNLLFAGIFDFDTISSDFKQTITNEENSQIVYEGSFYATTQKKALWIYKTPVEKKIYFNKNKVIILEPELEQAIITNLENTPNITELLKKSVKKDNGNYETRFQNTTYVIHTKNDVIKEITYKDKLANSVKIELFNQTTNTVLDDTLFQVKITFAFDIITQ